MTFGRRPSQFQLGEFGYFYVMLAVGALAFSWRTIFAFGVWTAGLWLGALALIALFGTELPELSEKAAVAFTGYQRILDVSDPNDPRIPERIQEVVIFLIVAATLAVNGYRNNRLIFQQANIARERANLARYFPPTIVDQMADRDEPLGAVRSQDVSVMFVDIVGFTGMAGRQSPEDVVALLRQFHARLEAKVFEHQGTLDKFLGDGLMATFGTPRTGTTRRRQRPGLRTRHTRGHRGMECRPQRGRRRTGQGFGWAPLWLGRAGRYRIGTTAGIRRAG